MTFPSKIHAAVTEGIKKSEKLHDIKPLQQAQERIKFMKPTRAYAWRKWNGKTRQREKVYKDHPPRDPFYNRG